MDSLVAQRELNLEKADSEDESMAEAVKNFEMYLWLLYMVGAKPFKALPAEFNRLLKQGESWF